MCPSSTDERSTVHRPRTQIASEGRRFAVMVVDGPDRGKQFELDPSQQGRVLVGTSPACTVQLSDSQVSRRHAALEFVGPDLRLVDLDSTNGTWFQGIRVMDVVIDGRVFLKVGASSLVIEPTSSPVALELPQLTSFGRVVGGSVAMRRLYRMCERLGQSEVPVLLEGETGTGKELMAEALHETGPRASEPFVVFDCSAVAPSLIESQLFGHERGAFTGASASRRGVFEQANKGTLFIDEIGDLELSLQARLLRAIERFEVCRVGGERWIKVDVRILAATRRDLDRLVQAGKFREDLFYRLAVARLEIPPLRHRHGDIGRLARHFWDTLGGADRPIPYDLFERFEEHSWPGNVRELRNAVARHLAVGDLEEQDETPVVEPSGNFMEDVLQKDLPLTQSKHLLVREFERRYVERVLQRCGGDAGAAASASGIARRYFNLLLARHR